MPANPLPPGTYVKLKPHLATGATGLALFGRIVEVRAPPGSEVEYFVEGDASSEPLPSWREDFTVLADQTQPPYPWFPFRKTLPYGRYVNTRTGVEVLFNRYYEPILKLMPDGSRHRCPDPKEWIANTRRDWFYNPDVGVYPWQETRPRRALRHRLIAIMDGAAVVPSDVVFVSPGGARLDSSKWSTAKRRGPVSPEETRRA